MPTHPSKDMAKSAELIYRESLETETDFPLTVSIRDEGLKWNHLQTLDPDLSLGAGHLGWTEPESLTPRTATLPLVAPSYVSGSPGTRASPS